MYKIGCALCYYCKNNLQVQKCGFSYTTFEPPNHVFFYETMTLKQEQNKNRKKNEPKKMKKYNNNNEGRIFLKTYKQ